MIISRHWCVNVSASLVVHDVMKTEDSFYSIFVKIPVFPFSRVWIKLVLPHTIKQRISKPYKLSLLSELEENRASKSTCAEVLYVCLVCHNFLFQKKKNPAVLKTIYLTYPPPLPHSATRLRFATNSSNKATFEYTDRCLQVGCSNGLCPFC